jgi:hypothetical protein
MKYQIQHINQATLGMRRLRAGLSGASTPLEQFDAMLCGLNAQNKMI